MQQLCVEAPLEKALPLQALLTCLGGPRGELFPPQIHEQAGQTI